MTEPERRPPRRLTRRKVVVGGLAAGGTLVGVDYARFAVGDEFESHVAKVLGISLASARELIGVARGRLGEPDYQTRAAAFLVATTFPGESIVPEAQRRHAVEGLVTNMIGRAGDNFVALGLRPYVAGPCQGLLKS